MSDFNTAIIDEFRTNGGVVGGHFEGKHLLLARLVGRKTGQERVQPLVYAEDGNNFLVSGSNGGAEKDPLWVANVEAMSEVIIEVGERTVKTKPVVLRDGPERERAYALLVAYWPDFLEYEKNTTRAFPVIQFVPVN